MPPGSLQYQHSGRLGRATSLPTPYHQGEAVAAINTEGSSASDGINVNARRSSNIRGASDSIASTGGPHSRDELSKISGISESNHRPHHINASDLMQNDIGNLERSPNMHVSILNEKPTARAISRADIIVNPSTLSRVFAPPLSSVDEGYVRRLRKLSNATAPSEFSCDAAETSDGCRVADDESVAKKDTVTADDCSSKRSITAMNQTQPSRDSLESRHFSSGSDALATSVEMTQTQLPDEARSKLLFIDSNGIPRHLTDSALGVGVGVEVGMRPRQASFASKRSPANDIGDILREDGLAVSTGRNPLTGKSRDVAIAAADVLLDLSPQHPSNSA